MEQVAEWIDRGVTAAGRGDEEALAAIRAEVADLMAAFRPRACPSDPAAFREGARTGARTVFLVSSTTGHGRRDRNRAPARVPLPYRLPHRPGRT